MAAFLLFFQAILAVDYGLREGDSAQLIDVVHDAPLNQSAAVPSILPSVVIIVNTVETREEMQHNILRGWERQRYSGKLTLLVFLQAQQESRWWKDQEARYTEMPNRSIQVLWWDLSTQPMLPMGLKRSALHQIVQEDIIVWYDDDDFYGPEYIPSVVGHLVGTRLAPSTVLVVAQTQIRFDVSTATLRCVGTDANRDPDYLGNTFASAL
jgi:hypothetical protein